MANELNTYNDRPVSVQRQMERARQRGDWAEWHRLARTNEAQRPTDANNRS